ncbi:hypothetical protein YC2023_039647 [Brassica napus]
MRGAATSRRIYDMIKESAKRPQTSRKQSEDPQDKVILVISCCRLCERESDDGSRRRRRRIYDGSRRIDDGSRSETSSRHRSWMKTTTARLDKDVDG